MIWLHVNKTDRDPERINGGGEKCVTSVQFRTSFPWLQSNERVLRLYSDTPQRERGLCKRCYKRHTSKTAQNSSLWSFCCCDVSLSANTQTHTHTHKSNQSHIYAHTLCAKSMHLCMFNTKVTFPSSRKDSKNKLLFTDDETQANHPEEKERTWEMSAVLGNFKSTWAHWMSSCVLPIRLHFNISILKIFRIRKNHKSPVAAQTPPCRTEVYSMNYWSSSRHHPLLLCVTHKKWESNKQHSSMRCVCFLCLSAVLFCSEFSPPDQKAEANAKVP